MMPELRVAEVTPSAEMPPVNQPAVCRLLNQLGIGLAAGLIVILSVRLFDFPPYPFAITMG